MFSFVREHFSPVEQLTRLSNNAITQIQIQNSKSKMTKSSKSNTSAIPDPAFVFAMYETISSEKATKIV